MSTIRVDNFAPSAGGTAFGIEGIAKAWVNAGSNAGLASSYNVSSGTDNGIGNYTYSFTNAFAAIPSGANSVTGSGAFFSNSAGNENEYSVYTFSGTSSLTDAPHKAVFVGDLA